MVGVGEQARLEILHFQPDDTAEKRARSHPGNVVAVFLKMQRQGLSAQAAELVLPEHRAVVQDMTQAVLDRSMNVSLQTHASTYIDDSKVVLLDDPTMRFHLRFAESQWWITDIVLDDAATNEN